MITLENLSEATAQEVFDQVAKHLLTQRQPSKTGAFCKYRLENLKCAAGCLIADNEYDEEFEGNNWAALIQFFGITREHGYLIQDLQTIHDSSKVDDWEAELRRVALRHELKYDPIEILGEPK